MTENHHTSSNRHAQLAAKDIDAITDPAQRASMNATLALAYALRSVGEDVRDMPQPLLKVQEAIRYPG